jgi:methyl-accepting chemotaxis protein
MRVSDKGLYGKYIYGGEVHAMWRNIKMSGKLLIGFGLLLVVFVLSVLFSWLVLKNVSESNMFLAQQVVPSMTEGAQFERDAYEVFLAARAAANSPTAAAIADATAKSATAQKSLAEVIALYTRTPGLVGPAHTATIVAPLAKQYISLLGDLLSALGRKNSALATMESDNAALQSRISSVTETLQSIAVRDAGNPSAAMSNIASLGQGMELWQSYEALEIALYSGIAKQDSKSLHDALDLCAEASTAAGKLRQEVLAPSVRSELDQVQKGLNDFYASLGQFVSAYDEVETVRGKMVSVMVSLNRESSAATDMSAKRVTVVSSESEDNLQKSIWILVGSAAVSVILGLFIAFLISRSIAGPLSHIVALAERTCGGDLTITESDFGYKGEDELGSLVDAIKCMVLTQEKAMMDVSSVAEKLESDAASLKSIAHSTNDAMEGVGESFSKVSTLTEANGAALEQCNAGVEEMSAGADTVAQSATESAAFISQTTEAANNAIQTVNGVISGMHGVDESSKSSQDKMRKLSASVDNVSGFVSVITGIADQTNLLALNAAIEAARAGDIGRGFAVVAEEVRKLAEESANAARNVNGVIGELQSGAQESIDATDEAGRLLEETLTKAEAAQKDLNDAIQQMDKANESIQNIAAVAEEQAASSKEVATGIDRATKSSMEITQTMSKLDEAAGDTMQTAHSLNDHADAMNGHANTLADVISRFKLKNSGKKSAGTGLKALKA